MTDIHLTRELLRAAARGDLPVHDLIDLGVEHLTALCPFCRGEMLAWEEERKAAAKGRDWGTALRVLPALLTRHGRNFADRLQAAERDLRDLLRLPHEIRLARIDRAASRFRGTVLAALLLEESRKRMPEDFGQVYELAEAAQAVLRRSPAGPDVTGFTVQAVTCMANARRATGDLQQARQHFEHARFLVRAQGVTDLSVLAELDWFEGALAMAQRRFTAAERLLTRSITLYTVTGDRVQTARPMLTLGLMYSSRGQSMKAAEVTQAAADLLPQDEDPRFYLSARHNLALFLCEAGRYRAAAEALAEDRDLYRQFPEPYTQLRLLWLEGNIAAGLGEAGPAEEVLFRARDGFLRQKNGYDAALVSLDLALLYARQERRAEIRRLAGEMHLIFESQDVHREALAALLLFREAAEKESITVERIKDLAAYLKAARTDPSLRFERW